MSYVTDDFGTVRQLLQLAQVAHECDLQLYRDGDGRWLCTSATDAGRLHYVTALSCECRGFVERQRCPHVALLLETLGWLPAVNAAPAAPINVHRQCPECSGAGTIYVPACAKAGWPFPCCPACNGTGDFPAGESRPQGGHLNAAA